MANVAKYTKSSLTGLSNHNIRAKDKNGEYYKHKNQEIDTSKSHLNYNLAPHNLSPEKFVKQRITEVECLNRKDVNVMVSWVVTKPIGVKAEEQELFFQETYKFLEKEYGKENVAGAWVHLDEVSPHMHFSFVPVVFDKKKEKLKVSAKEIINRNSLQQFHPKLEKHLEKVFGREVGILNEATKEGNKSIDELKKDTAIKTLNELKKFEEFKNTPAPALEKLVAKMLPKEHFKVFKQVELLEQDIQSLKTENNHLKSDIESKDNLIKKQEQEIKKINVKVQDQENYIDNYKNKILQLKINNRDFKERLDEAEKIIKSDPELLDKFLKAKKEFQNQGFSFGE
jgi:hypothetical protein